LANLTPDPPGIGMAFDPVDCTMCGQTIPSLGWLEHARTHNPSAYTEGWPCDCRHGALCEKHQDRRYPDDYPRVTR
jgi:hypothetical protein